jgi:hypothetical protein
MNENRIAAREDGCPLQPNSLTHEFVRILAKAADVPVSDFMISDTLTPPIFSQTV